MADSRTSAKLRQLAPEVNRILYVRNLPFKISAEELYDLFGRYGAIRQIRVGNTNETRGTAFVVYEDVFDAKNACEHLAGFQVGGRFLIVLYYSPTKSKVDSAGLSAQVSALRARVKANEDAEGEGEEESIEAQSK